METCASPTEHLITYANERVSQVYNVFFSNFDGLFVIINLWQIIFTGVMSCSWSDWQGHCSWALPELPLAAGAVQGLPSQKPHWRGSNVRHIYTSRCMASKVNNITRMNVLMKFGFLKSPYFLYLITCTYETPKNNSLNFVGHWTKQKWKEVFYP